MKYQIIFTDHFKAKRTSTTEFSRSKRKPNWFNMRTAGLMVTDNIKKIDKLSNKETLVIRMELDKVFQYFLIRADKEQEGLTKIVFLSALRLQKKKAFLPYKEVSLNNRVDFRIKDISRLKTLEQEFNFDKLNEITT